MRRKCAGYKFAGKCAAWRAGPTFWVRHRLPTSDLLWLRPELLVAEEEVASFGTVRGRPRSTPNSRYCSASLFEPNSSL
jgi:hypothetical protein